MKQSVALEGVRYPLVFLTPPTYKELLEKVGTAAKKVNLRTKGYDEQNPLKNIVIEIKGFAFNGCVFTEELKAADPVNT